MLSDGAADDEDDDTWGIRHPASMLTWLWTVMQSVEWQWPPHHILECDERYPGLIDDLIITRWRVHENKPRAIEVGGQAYRED